MSADRRGLPFVVAAPSGTGKTTVCRAVVDRDEGIAFSISHTTRAPREGERDGVDYHFVTSEEMLSLVEAGVFLEHAEYAGNIYGTSWRALREPLERGLDLLIEIEVQGARQVREQMEEARFIFLLPPSMKVLEERLRARGTDSDDEVARRLSVADLELRAIEIFDYAVVNDDLETAIGSVQEIIRLERAGRSDDARSRHGREVVWARWQTSEDRS
ncbi:MAG: guanylate kinase [Myxococcota bacterium]